MEFGDKKFTDLLLVDQLTVLRLKVRVRPLILTSTIPRRKNCRDVYLGTSSTIKLPDVNPFVTKFE